MNLALPLPPFVSAPALALALPLAPATLIPTPLVLLPDATDTLAVPATTMALLTPVGVPSAYNIPPAAPADAATEYVVPLITVADAPATTGCPLTKYVSIAVGAGAVSIRIPPEEPGGAGQGVGAWLLRGCESGGCGELLFGGGGGPWEGCGGTAREEPRVRVMGEKYTSEDCVVGVAGASGVMCPLAERECAKGGAEGGAECGAGMEGGREEGAGNAPLWCSSVGGRGFD